MQAAKAHIEAGYDWVVNLDLAQFFDRVQHDKLMARVARRIEDKRVLRLIRSYLVAGVMCDGVMMHVGEGTPQGGPLSPLLGNIMLDDLDRELTARGLRFCRYADDVNIYVGSRRAGDRVMTSVRRFVEGRLGLKVNERKSMVDRPWNCTFLGFSFYRRNRTLLCTSPSPIRATSTLARPAIAPCHLLVELPSTPDRPDALGHANRSSLAAATHAFRQFSCTRPDCGAHRPGFRGQAQDGDISSTAPGYPLPCSSTRNA